MKVNRLYNPIFLEKFFQNAFLTVYCGWILTVRCWSTHVWRQIGDKATNLKDSDFLRDLNFLVLTKIRCRQVSRVAGLLSARRF